MVLESNGAPSGFVSCVMEKRAEGGLSMI
jgi:hypothetical protein